MSAWKPDWRRILKDIPAARRDGIRTAIEKAVALYRNNESPDRSTRSQWAAWDQVVKRCDKLASAIKTLGSDVPEPARRFAKELADMSTFAAAHSLHHKPRNNRERLYSAIFAAWESAVSAPRLSADGPYVRFHQAIMEALGRQLGEEGVKDFVERERKRLAARQIVLAGKGGLTADATVLRASR
jgi:hypothetical protein